VGESPITRWFADVSRTDLESALSAFAPDARVLSPDGRRAEGAAAIRVLLEEVFAAVRECSYETTAQWNQGDTWIAELLARYELRDYAQIGPLPRAVIARTSGDGIADLRIYGAHEPPLGEHRTGEEGIRVGGRWIPPL
jgi:hypothetical protein